jgi:hypothetical protein
MSSQKRQVAAARQRQQVVRASDVSSRGSSIPPDDLTIKPAARVRLERPSYEKGPALLRPLPMLCAEDPSKFDPARNSADPKDYYGWMIPMPVARGIGTNQLSMILHAPANWDAGYRPSTENPYILALKNVYKAFKDGKDKAGRAWNPAWNPLVAKDAKTRVWRPPTVNWYMHGLAYYNGENNYLRENGGVPLGATGDEPVIWQLSSSAGGPIWDMFDIPRPGYQGPSTDYEKFFKYGDPLGVNAQGQLTGPGKLILICSTKSVGLNPLWMAPDFVPEKGKTYPTSLAEKVSHNVRMEQSAGSKKRGGGFDGYEIAVLSAMPSRAAPGGKILPNVDPAWTENIIYNQNHSWFWEDVLHIPSHDELCVMLVKAFDQVPTMLERFLFDPYPEFRSEETKAMMAKRMQARIPKKAGEEGAGQPQGARERPDRQVPPDPVDDFDPGAVDAAWGDTQSDADVEHNQETDPTYDGVDPVDGVDGVDDIVDAGELDPTDVADPLDADAALEEEFEATAAADDELPPEVDDLETPPDAELGDPDIGEPADAFDDLSTDDLVTLGMSVDEAAAADPVNEPGPAATAPKPTANATSERIAKQLKDVQQKAAQTRRVAPPTKPTNNGAGAPKDPVSGKKSIPRTPPK